MINLSQPITGKQIVYFVVGTIATVATIALITFSISWAWKKGQE